MRGLWRQNGVIPMIRATALIAFAGYIVWNAAWLLLGHIPPSIFAYCTGLPCPTTGMTRSIVWLVRGDLRNCLLFNPFTVVYLSLAAISTCILLKRALQRRVVVLPSSVGWAWFIALAFGWMTKFALGNQYW